ncbi:MAG: transposase [Roseiflexaceae bacterium]|nr:transposase [Roseiflexaceae bacterium]
MKAIYQAATREAAETKLVDLGERWGERHAIAVRSWESNWNELATMFAYPAEIRRMSSTTNSIEATTGSCGRHQDQRGVPDRASCTQVAVPDHTRHHPYLADAQELNADPQPARHSVG